MNLFDGRLRREVTEKVILDVMEQIFNNFDKCRDCGQLITLGDVRCFYCTNYREQLNRQAQEDSDAYNYTNNQPKG